MKTIFYLICVFILLSCQPEIQNDETTLNEIFNAKDYTIRVSTCGCFGCGKYTYIVKNDDKIITISNPSGNQKIEVSKDRMESFKSFMSQRIGKNIRNGLCSSNYQFQVETNKSKVTFTDEGCSEWDTLNNIIPLKSIPDCFVE